MKHAGAAALAQLAALLAVLRGVAGLQERSPGVFYHKSRSFLHFHEDAAGLFADIRCGGDDFERLAVGSAAGQAALIAKVEAFLQGKTR